MNSLNIFRQTLINSLDILRSPRAGLKHLYGISLYRNAVYLMLNNVSVSAAGFFFWVAAAKIYSTEAVGLASATIAMTLLLGTISTFGMDFAIIRFLPNAGEKAKDMLNSCFTVSGLASIAVAFGFVCGIDFLAIDLHPIKSHPLFFIIFIITVFATTLKILSERIFTAKRRTGFALAQGLLFGLTRFIPLFILAMFFQSFGIITAWGLSLLLAIGVSIIVFLPKIQTGYFPFPIIKKQILKKMIGFSLSNYAVSLSGVIPGAVLSIMVLNMLGAEQSAYFYVGWTIGVIISKIPVTISLALFAEGVHKKEAIRTEILRGFKLMSFLLGPVILLIVLIADKVLMLFGEDYSEDATQLVQLLSISVIPVGINQIYFAIKRAKTQMNVVIKLSLFSIIMMLISSYFLLNAMGITGIGLARIISHGTVTAIILLNILKNRVLQQKEQAHY